MARYAEVNIAPGPPGEPIIDTAEGIRDIPNNFPLEMNEAPRHELDQADLFIEGEFEIPYEVDPAQPMNTIHITDTSVSQDQFGNKYKTGSKRWGTDVADSLMVFERSSSDFTAGVINITTANGSTSIIQGRQKGRKSVTIWVPSTFTNAAGTTSTPLGVIIGQTEGEVQQYAGVQLNAGDSITINTEAPIWAGVLGGNSTGLCQYLVEYNPAGGELGGQ